MEDLYTYDGYDYTLSEIQEEVNNINKDVEEASKITFDDYLNKHGFKKKEVKKSTAQGSGAVVGENESNTDLASGNGSSDSVDPKIYKFGGYEYSADELQKDAVEKDMPFNDYVEKYGFIEKGNEDKLEEGLKKSLTDKSWVFNPGNEIRSLEGSDRFDSAIDLKDWATIINKDELAVETELQNAYPALNIQQTGIGDAILIQDPLDPENFIELDLQPLTRDGYLQGKKVIDSLKELNNKANNKKYLASKAVSEEDFDDRELNILYNPVGYNVENITETIQEGEGINKKDREINKVVIKKEGEIVATLDNAIEAQKYLKDNMTEEEQDKFTLNLNDAYYSHTQKTKKEVAKANGGVYSPAGEYRLKAQKAITKDQARSQYLEDGGFYQTIKEQLEKDPQFTAEDISEVLLWEQRRRRSGAMDLISDFENTYNQTGPLFAGDEMKLIKLQTVADKVLSSGIDYTLDKLIETKTHTIAEKALVDSGMVDIIGFGTKLKSLDIQKQKETLEVSKKAILDSQKQYDTQFQKTISTVIKNVKDVGFEITVTDDGQPLMNWKFPKSWDEEKKKKWNETNPYAAQLEKAMAVRKSQQIDLIAADSSFRNRVSDYQNQVNVNAEVGSYAFLERDMSELLIKDFWDATVTMGASVPALIGSDAAIEKIKSLQDKDQYYEALGTYDDDQGRGGRFAARTFAQQGPNMILAIATSGIGMAPLTARAAVGLTAKKISTDYASKIAARQLTNIVATEFGIIAAGGKNAQITIDKAAGEDAKKTLAFLEANKNSIPVNQYISAKIEAEKIIAYGDINGAQRVGAVVASGIAEGTVMKYIGTGANSVKLVQGFAKPLQGLASMEMKTGIAAVGEFLKTTGIAVGGEVLEETTIEAINILIDAVALGREIPDDWGLDDVAVTSVIMAGPMNGPSTGYAALMQNAAGRKFNANVQRIRNELTKLETGLLEQGINKEIVATQMQNLVEELGGANAGLESDVMVLGGENMVNLIRLDGALKGLYKEAGIAITDSDQQVSEKISSYKNKLTKAGLGSEAKLFQTKYDNLIKTKNDILSDIDYKGAVERVLGTRGVEIEKELKESNDTAYEKAETPREKFIIVAQAVKNIINQEAAKTMSGDRGIRQKVDEIILQENKGIKPDGRKKDIKARKQELFEQFGKIYTAGVTNKSISFVKEEMAANEILSDETLSEIELTIAKDQQTLIDAVNASNLNADQKAEMINGIENENVTGVIIDNQYISIDKEGAAEAIKNGRISAGTVVSHEIGHAIDSIAFKSVLERTDYAEKLFDYAEANYSLEHQRAFDRLKVLDIYDDTKSFIDQSDKAKEEYARAFQDALKDKVLDGSVSELNELSTIVFGKAGELFGTDFEIETGKDALIYAADYIQSFDQKKVSSRAKRKIAAAEKLGINALKEELGSVKFSEDTFSQTNELINNEISALYGVTTESESFGDVWNGLSKEEKMSLGVQLGPIWEKQAKIFLDGYANAKGLDKNFFGGLESDILKFMTTNSAKGANALPFIVSSWNPNLGRSLTSHIFGLLPLRIPAILRKFPDLGKKIRLSEDSKMMENIVEEESTYQEQEEFVKILDSKMLSDIAVNNIKQKVISSVRVLKSKIDNASTKNKRTTPFVTEFLQSINTQADIDLKKAIGVLKGGEINKFLINNKATILENMTTTWLSKAIPSAIEKSVGGKYRTKNGKLVYKNVVGKNGKVSKQKIFDTNYTTDWQGKIIDREGVGANSAGSTSGRDYVRRLPGVAEMITDKEFVENFIKDDKLKRGSKESLAKALAGEVGLEILEQGIIEKNKVFDALVTNQKALGVAEDLITVGNIAKQIDRGTVKFSQDNAKEQLWSMIEDAVRYGADSSTFQSILLTFDEDLITIAQESGLLSRFGESETGFKRPLLNWKNFPDIYDSVKEQLETYKTDKNNPIALKQLHIFSKQLYTSLPPSLVKKLGADFFGFTNRYLDPAASKRDKITKKVLTGQSGLYNKEYNEFIEYTKQPDPSDTKLPFDTNSIRIFNSGFGLMGKIEKILNQDFETWQAKQAAVEKTLGGEITSANENNIVAFQYLMEKATTVLENANIKTENGVNQTAGFLRWLEASTNNTKAQRGLTTLPVIEYHAKSQAPYVDVLTGKYYTTLNPKQKASDNFQLNRKHPNYKDAVSFVEQSLGHKIVDPNNKFTLEKLNGKTFVEDVAQKLGYKGEHIAPAANTMLKLAQSSLTTSALLKEQPASRNQTLKTYRLETQEILSDYSQSLGSKLLSDIQDDKTLGIGKAQIGSTSRLNDLRGLVLTDSQLGNFKTPQGVDGISYIKRKIFEDKNIEKLIEKIRSKKVQEDNRLVEQARDFRGKYSEDISKDFNDIIEQTIGITSDKRYSDVVAKRKGANKGKYRFFVPPSAEDFVGLIYDFLGKGKQGEAHMDFFNNNLVNPYNKGIQTLNNAKQAIIEEYRTLTKKYPDVKKKLGKIIPDTDFTYDQALRVNLWTKAGYKIPGLSKRDIQQLNAIINKDSELQTFAGELSLIARQKEVWTEPSENWDTNSIVSDLNDITDKVGRKQFLQEFIENKNTIFSKENLNKIEANYGTRYREALEDILFRMENGTNRNKGSENRLVNSFNNWINNSVGAIMFFNRRSAVLQLLSTVNFVNWSDNNPIKAAVAFANQPQYWKDFAFIFNSPKLKQRRRGLQTDVNESEIANAAANSKNKAQAVLSYLLKIGFTPTQIADSFAIATGGAAMYRNRINTYIKDGMTKADAESKAWEDFSAISEATQQSADPSMISQQQASVLGRFILAFQNTPMQYNRLMKKAGRDLINGRGDYKTNISKIMYYGFVQNLIFSALQNALFALIPGFDDEEEEEEDLTKKQGKIINGMVDTLLRGSGVAGAIASTIKNIILEYNKQEEKGYIADHTYTLIQALNLSPPVGSKFRKAYSAIQTGKFQKKAIEARGLSVMEDGRFNLSPKYDVYGDLLSATLNIPLDRAIAEINIATEALDERNSTWQRVALALGWRTWGLNVKDEEDDKFNIKTPKIKRSGKFKSKFGAKSFKKKF